MLLLPFKVLFLVAMFGVWIGPETQFSLPGFGHWRHFWSTSLHRVCPCLYAAGRSHLFWWPWPCFLGCRIYSAHFG